MDCVPAAQRGMFGNGQEVTGRLVGPARAGLTVYRRSFIDPRSTIHDIHQAVSTKASVFTFRFLRSWYLA